MIFSSVASSAENFLDHLALTRHQYPVGKGHDLGQVGGDDDHRLALVGEAADEFVDLDDGADVDATRRLIEDGSGPALALATWR